jgi:hypothetical protein
MNKLLNWLFGSEQGDHGDYTGVTKWWISFVSDHGPKFKIAVFLGFVALVWLVIRSYRREGRTPARIKAILACLRLVVVLLVFIIIFQPALVLRFTQTLHKQLVCLVDSSMSLSFKDKYNEKTTQQIADAAGLKPAQIEDLSRMDLASAMLLRTDGAFAILAKDHPIQVVKFSTPQPGKEPYTRAMGDPIDKVLAEGAVAPAHFTVSPEFAKQWVREGPPAGFETDIAAGGRDTIDMSKGHEIAGIIVVSDFQDNSENAAETNRKAAVREYALRNGIPIYTVLVGDPTPPKEVAITSFQAPQDARKGSAIEFAVSISHRNLTGQTVKLHLLKKASDQKDFVDTHVEKDIVLTDDAPKADGTKSEAGEGRGTNTVTVELTPDELGEFVFRASIDPVPGQRNTKGNVADARVRVTDDKINVLLIGSEAGWEFQGIRNFLLTQPDLYRISVWQQNADPDLNQVASSKDWSLKQLPKEESGLIGTGDDKKPAYDVVILYDPENIKDSVDDNFCQLLEKSFVWTHGGGLCYIAGTKFTEENLRISAGKPIMSKHLTDLLPVVIGVNRYDSSRLSSEKPEGWRIHVTSYGLDHPATRLGATAEETQQFWDSMPVIYWSHQVEKLKPAAKVLLENANPLLRTGSGEPEPLLVAQPYGKGRVLYMGTNEMWRMRAYKDSYYYRRFLTNMMRFLATSKARQCIITTGGDRFSLGAKITVEAEVYDATYKPLKAAEYKVDMINLDTQETRHLTLTAIKKPGKSTEEQEEFTGRFKTEIVAERTGRFQFTSTELRDDKDAGDKIAPKQIVIELPQAEAAKPEADLAGAQSWASPRAENFVNIWDADKLAKIVPAAKKVIIDDKALEFWDRRYSLLLIVLLLGIEWVLRKKYNMM